MTRVALVELEDAEWSAEVGLDINDPIATDYRIVQVNGAISLVMCNSIPYAGWLAKQVSPLIYPAERIDFCYSMMTDDATLACAQVAETDAKITDKDGWTYDLSAQWEMSKVAPDWMFQIDHEGWSWTDSGIMVPAATPYVERDHVIEYAIDYVNHKSAVLGESIDGERCAVPENLHWISARQEGWQPETIVTQLQQCNNGQPGGYTLRFTKVGYVLEVP
jgi:hypothetical protein